MIAGSIEFIIQVVKWGIKAVLLIGLFTPFIALFLFAMANINTAINQSVIGDFMGIVQIWLPFNIDVLFMWVFTSIGLFTAYKLALVVYQWGVSTIGTN